jgi:hypothetical protein
MGFTSNPITGYLFQAEGRSLRKISEPIFLSNGNFLFSQDKILINNYLNLQ